MANLSVVVAIIFRITTEDSVHPTSLGVMSPLSFGRGGRLPRRRKVNGVNVTTTAFLATDRETHMNTDIVNLTEVAWHRSRTDDSDASIEHAILRTKDGDEGSIAKYQREHLEQ